MATPGRSAGVTAAGIIAIIGVSLSLFGLLLASLSLKGPRVPVFARTMMGGMMIFFLAIAVFGIFTGVGLLRLKNWARVSALVWAGISAPLSAFVILILMLVPFPTPPNAPAVSMSFVRSFILLFYGIPIGVGLWWLILFNRKATAAQFAACVPVAETVSPGTASEPLAAQPTAPLPVTVLTWFSRRLHSASFSCFSLTCLPSFSASRSEGRQERVST
jgi:hypothetical protein